MTSIGKRIPLKLSMSISPFFGGHSVFDLVASSDNATEPQGGAASQISIGRKNAQYRISQLICNISLNLDIYFSATGAYIDFRQLVLLADELKLTSVLINLLRLSLEIIPISKSISLNGIRVARNKVSPALSNPYNKEIHTLNLRDAK